MNVRLYFFSAGIYYIQTFQSVNAQVGGLDRGLDVKNFVDGNKKY